MREYGQHSRGLDGLGTVRRAGLGDEVPVFPLARSLGESPLQLPRSRLTRSGLGVGDGGEDGRGGGSDDKLGHYYGVNETKRVCAVAKETSGSIKEIKELCGGGRGEGREERGYMALAV